MAVVGPASTLGAGSYGFARTLRVIQNDTDLPKDTGGIPRPPHNPSQKDGNKKPSSVAVNRKAAS